MHIPSLCDVNVYHRPGLDDQGVSCIREIIQSSVIDDLKTKLAFHEQLVDSFCSCIFDMTRQEKQVVDLAEDKVIIFF